eukprot:jgi/Mesvir1/7225/Mv19042-RA.1
MADANRADADTSAPGSNGGIPPAVPAVGESRDQEAPLSMVALFAQMQAQMQQQSQQLQQQLQAMQMREVTDRLVAVEGRHLQSTRWDGQASMPGPSGVAAEPRERDQPPTSGNAAGRASMEPGVLAGSLTQHDLLGEADGQPRGEYTLAPRRLPFDQARDGLHEENGAGLARAMDPHRGAPGRMLPGGASIPFGRGGGALTGGSTARWSSVPIGRIPPMEDITTPLAFRVREAARPSTLAQGRAAQRPPEDADGVQYPQRVRLIPEGAKMPTLPRVDMREKFSTTGNLATLAQAYNAYKSWIDLQYMTTQGAVMHEFVMNNMHFFFHGLTLRRVARLVEQWREVSLYTRHTDVWFGFDGRGQPDYDNIMYGVDPAEELWGLLRQEYPVETIKAEREWRSFKIAEGETPEQSYERLMEFAGEVEDWSEKLACQKWLQALGSKEMELPTPPNGQPWRLRSLCIEVRAMMRRHAQGRISVSTVVAELQAKVDALTKAKSA